MKRLFVDTFYYLALLNVKDSDHERAAAFSDSTNVPLITTAWVLTELADGLCHPTRRGRCTRFLNAVQQDPQTSIVPPSSELFDAGVELYEARSDKDWSLTDCISFVVMEQHQMNEALTADHHFEQAGFVALLK